MDVLVSQTMSPPHGKNVIMTYCDIVLVRTIKPDNV